MPDAAHVFRFVGGPFDGRVEARPDRGPIEVHRFRPRRQGDPWDAPVFEVSGYYRPGSPAGDEMEWRPAPTDDSQRSQGAIRNGATDGNRRSAQD